MAFGYEYIFNLRRKRGLLSQDFKPEESNNIITNLVRKIEQYEQARNVKTEYDKVETERGVRITKARIRSGDKIVEGTIAYQQPDDSDLLSEDNAMVVARINFNSKSKADMQEYLGLIRIVEGM